MSPPLRFCFCAIGWCRRGPALARPTRCFRSICILCAGATAHGRPITPQQICALTFTEKRPPRKCASDWSVASPPFVGSLVPLGPKMQRRRWLKQNPTSSQAASGKQAAQHRVVGPSSVESFGRHHQHISRFRSGTAPSLRPGHRRRSRVCPARRKQRDTATAGNLRRAGPFRTRRTDDDFQRP